MSSDVDEHMADLSKGLRSHLDTPVSAQWQCLPSSRALWLTGLAMLPLLFVPLAYEVVYAVAAFDVVLGLGIVMDYLVLRRSANLLVHRVREPRLSVGGDNEVTLVFENLGREPLRVWARDGYPGEFDAAGDDIGTNDELTLKGLPRNASLPFHRDTQRDADVEGEGEADRARLGLRRRLARELTPGGAVGEGILLSPRTRLSVRYFLTPNRRGDYAFGDIHLRLEAGLRLATATAVYPAREPLKVYPNIRNVRQLGLASRYKDLNRLGLKTTKRPGGGGEFSKLRDYVAGDSYRDINWKATARRRKPITEVYEAERCQTLMICIDASRAMAANDGQLSRLDHAINAALLLAYTALTGDDRVGVLVFGSGVTMYLRPRKGKAQYKRILAALYGIESDAAHADYATMLIYLMARLRSRAMVVLFTDIGDEITAEELVPYTRHLRPRHLPICVSLSDKALHAMQHAIPDSREVVFDRVVATEIARERNILKTNLARAGAHVVNRPVESFTIDILNTYLDIKERRIL